jgi:alpha-glucosidase
MAENSKNELIIPLLQYFNPLAMPHSCTSKGLFILLLSLIISNSVIAADTTFVKSPGGEIVFRLFQKMGKFYFTVSLAGITVISPSPMDFSVNGSTLTKDVSILRSQRYNGKQTYAVLGAHSKASVTYNGIILFLRKTGSTMQANLDIRVFNDGVAFRHNVVSPGAMLSPSESTVFNLPSKSMLWFHDLYMHYEGVHARKAIDSIEEGQWVAPPATFKLTQGIYASITEADLLGYPGMALLSNGQNGLAISLANEQPTSYPYKLRYSPEDTFRLRQPARMKGKVTTPWRVALIGKDLNTLVNSDIITSLNPAPDPKLFPAGIQTDWIRPGRAVWKYLDGGGDGTLEVARHFTDGAAALGFEHNILEGFWTRWSDQQLKELADYSRQKGVGIWLWKHSKSLRMPSSRDSFFSKCHSLGITGAKIDFFDSEAKEVIDLYDSILHDAARYHVLLDFHGANKPTGLARTFPNSLTYEAVKGMEASKLTDRATHETTIPFTRCLAGPAEYTVMLFNERRKNTTIAHQIASAAILSAPLLTYAANPATILNSPAVNIIKAVPPTWDETIVLSPSEIGELAVYARRKGNSWFLAVMNGSQAKIIKIPLGFLKGDYKAEVAKDDPLSAAAVIVEKKTYSSGNILQLHLSPGGGFIAMFSKK